jgi:hypothetical protein
LIGTAHVNLGNHARAIATFREGRWAESSGGGLTAGHSMNMLPAPPTALHDRRGLGPFG